MDILGGLDFGDGTTEIVDYLNIGGSVRHKLRSSIIGLRALGDAPRPDKLADAANDLLGLTRRVSDIDTLCTLFDGLYSLPDKELVAMLSKALGMLDPVIEALRRVFRAWLAFIETCLRIIFAGVGAAVPGDARLIEIPLPDDPRLAALHGALKKYVHRGFCPFEPIKRLTNLLSYPWPELLGALKKIEPNAVVHLHGFGQRVRKAAAPLKLSAPTLPARPAACPPELHDKLNGFLDYCRTIYPALEAREKEYIKITKALFAVAAVIDDARARLQ